MYETIYHGEHMNQSQNNPLAAFYRVPTFTVTLPSRGAFYAENVVELGADGEVAILPMTAADEILMKNPDALLNGEAVIGCIKSCVPAVKAPRKLLSCDLDALLVGIRAASYGSQNEINSLCPACGAENSYTVDFETLLDAVEPLETHYDVVLDSGVTVVVGPSTFDAVVKQQRAVFEGSKLQRSLNDESISEEARLRMFSDAFNRLNKLNFEMILDSITEVQITDAEGNDVTVKDRRHIADFLKNIDSQQAKTIETKISDVNSHGVKKELDAVCRGCGHEWKIPVEYNDTNFSLGS